MKPIPFLSLPTLITYQFRLTFTLVEFPINTKLLKKKTRFNLLKQNKPILFRQDTIF